MKYNFDVLRYFSQVWKLLPCRGRQRSGIMKKFRSQVEQYARDKDRVSYADLVSHYGTPEQIASTCLNEQDEMTILRDMRFGKRVVKIVAGAVVAIVLCWAVTMGMVLVDNYSADDYIEVRISEGGKDWSLVETSSSGEGETFVEWLEGLWFK